MAFSAKKYLRDNNLDDIPIVAVTAYEQEFIRDEL